MKLLLMPELDFETYLKYSRERLDMCNSPSSTQGLLVELTRDIGVPGYTKGSQGIARPFNALDIYDLIKKYNMEIKFKIQGLPDLSDAFDFFPYVTKDGKRVVSIFHTHITRFDFKVISTRKYRKIQPVQLNFNF